jgi:hypothetical protein
LAHFKLHEADEKFLGVPQSGTLVFSGASGTQTWIEREKDTVVRITVQSVAASTAHDGSLEVSIKIGEDCAKGQDGPSPAETQLRASQSVQVLVRAGERVAFSAYPVATSAHILRTVVWTSDLKHQPPSEQKSDQKPRPTPDDGAASTER